MPCFMKPILCLLLASLSLNGFAAEIDWVLEAKASWQARDSQAEWVFKDQLWIGGGWFQSFEEPPRDVWSSSDGKAWKLIAKNAPWLHSDLAMSITFHDRMWIMGGWHKGRLPGHSASHEVWSSADGAKWEQVTQSAQWSPRLAAGLVEHRGRLWLLGGIEDYYFGDDASLKNDVWSSADGKAWKQIGFPSNVQLGTVTCAGDGKVYISGEGGSLWVGRDSTWKSIHKGSSSILWNDAAWFDGQLWLSSDCQFRVWNGSELLPVTHKGELVSASGHMDVRDGLLGIARPTHVWTFDGQQWRTIVAPYLD